MNPETKTEYENILEIRGLVKEYRGEGETIRVIDGLDLEIPRNSIASVEGASGVGKSTLLNIIGTIDHYDGGEIVIQGKRVDDLNGSAREYFRASTLGFIFQHHYLLPDFTVLENVVMPLLIQRKVMRTSLREATDALKLVGLGHRLNHYPSQISGGEMARAGVARALVGDKKLLLADEPTGNLDRGNSDKLADLLWKLQEEMGFTLLMVTHDQHLASRVPLRYQLEGGKLLPRDPARI